MTYLLSNMCTKITGIGQLLLKLSLVVGWYTLFETQCIYYIIRIVSLFRLSVDRAPFQDGRMDGQPDVYSLGIDPTRHRTRRPRVGGAVRRTRFGPDLQIRQKTGWPHVPVMLSS